MHAWVWVSNPDGVFADENWALPYLRVGLQPPARIDPHTARALALLHDDGVGFYATVLRSVTDRDFTTYLNDAARRVSTEPPAQFATVWRGMVERIVDVVDAGSRPRVRRALGVDGHSH